MSEREQYITNNKLVRETRKRWDLKLCSQSHSWLHDAITKALLLGQTESGIKSIYSYFYILKHGVYIFKSNMFTGVQSTSQIFNGFQIMWTIMS